MLGFHGEVVDLMAYRSDAAQPAEFLQMEGYWQALRGPEGGLPERARFDPRGIAGLLGVTLLLERVSAGEVRIRLAGMALHEMLGMELRGMPLSALVVPDSRAALAIKVERVFDSPAVGRLNFAAEPGFGRPPCSARLLLLPMIGASGAVDRALGALVCEGVLGKAPRRLVLETSQLERISNRRLPRPAAAPASPPTTAPELAEAAAAFDHAQPTRYPHLRLVKG